MAATGMLCGKVPLGALSDIHACMYGTCTNFFFSSLHFLCVYFPQKKYVHSRLSSRFYVEFNLHFIHISACTYVSTFCFDFLMVHITKTFLSSQSDHHHHHSLFLPIFHSFLHGLCNMGSFYLSISVELLVCIMRFDIFPVFILFSLYIF